MCKMCCFHHDQALCGACINPLHPRWGIRRLLDGARTTSEVGKQNLLPAGLRNTYIYRRKEMLEAAIKSYQTILNMFRK